MILNPVFNSVSPASILLVALGYFNLLETVVSSFKHVVNNTIELIRYCENTEKKKKKHCLGSTGQHSMKFINYYYCFFYFIYK